MSNSPVLIDSHCHFDFPVFDADRAAVWAAANANGVSQMIIPGVAPEQWSTAAQVSREFPGIFRAAGIHPWWVKGLLSGDDCQARVDELREALRRELVTDSCVALGECGLDKLKEVNLERQQRLFAMQVELASELELPLIIHCCKAHNEVIALLRRHRLPAGGVIHAFSGSTQIAKTYVELGFRLGIGGTITYERARKTRQAVANVPLTALLLESDAPDMPLCGRQGERNSPQYLPDIAQVLAQLRGQPLEEIILQTSDNSRRLFNLPQEVLL